MARFISEVATIASRTLIAIIFGEEASVDNDTSIVADAFNLCWTMYAPPRDERYWMRSFVCRSRDSYVWRLQTRLKLSFGRLIIW